MWIVWHNRSGFAEKAERRLKENGIMHKVRLIYLVTAILLLLGGREGTAGDIVLNYAFETQDTLHWIETGTVPYQDRGVVKFDVTGNGHPSWAYYQHPGYDFSGGLQQTLYVQAGVTYRISADICYHSG
ncbi:MAG: hypothetical protein ABIK28_23755 [Planctomycetota bacterium]